MIVDWARHGENVANLTHTFSHRIFDGDLTDVGREQAVLLGRHLAANGIGYVVLASSPLRRGRQTAEIVAEHLGRKVDLYLEDFREINVGELDGRSDAESWTTHDRILEQWRDGDLTARFPGGESGRDLVDRVRRGLRTVAGRAADGPALVIGHGGNLRAVLPALTGSPDPGLDLPTGDLARLEVDVRPDRGPVVRLLEWGTDPAGDASLHLRDAAASRES